VSKDALSFTVSNALSEVPFAAARVEAFCRDKDIPAPIAYKFGLALDETLTNVISYAFADGQRHAIEIRLEYRDGYLTALMSDDGAPFDPLSQPEPDVHAPVEERKIGGLGIHLVRKLMDKASYERRIAAILLAAACAPTAAQSPPRASPPVADIGSMIETLDPSRGTGVYPLFSSANLDAGSATARQALIIIHGRLRNAADYYATGLALAKAAGAAGDATVVVAPQFLLQADTAAHQLPDSYLRWSRGWEEGAPALAPASVQSSDLPPSSYDVLDDIVAKLSNARAFPALTRIAFVGHGGGAQMLARYAVVMHARTGPPVSFVIANAGTYLYPTTARPVALDCPDFNLWKYGLDQPPPYVKDAGKILKDFAARDVTLLLGDRDRKTDGIIDQSCAAETQGRNRFERGRHFAKAMAASGIAPRLKYVIVPGVGHNENGMLLSAEAMAAIFAAGSSER
jgi:anti-sigma regulatory factor (Ser/Thr protein kinase)